MFGFKTRKKLNEALLRIDHLEKMNELVVNRLMEMLGHKVVMKPKPKPEEKKEVHREMYETFIERE